MFRAHVFPKLTQSLVESQLNVLYIYYIENTYRNMACIIIASSLFVSNCKKTEPNTVKIVKFVDALTGPQRILGKYAGIEYDTDICTYPPPSIRETSNIRHLVCSRANDTEFSCGISSSSSTSLLNFNSYGGALWPYNWYSIYRYFIDSVKFVSILNVPKGCGPGHASVGDLYEIHVFKGRKYSY